MTYEHRLYCLQLKSSFRPKMDLKRSHFRAIIFHNFRRGLSRQECFDELNSLYGEQAPSLSTIKNWYNEFNRGRRSLQDEFREGRPKSVVLPENVDAVRKQIIKDPHVTYRQLEASLGISATSIHTILHEHLAIKKVGSRWILEGDPPKEDSHTQT